MFEDHIFLLSLAHEISKQELALDVAADQHTICHAAAVQFVFLHTPLMKQQWNQEQSFNRDRL